MPLYRYEHPWQELWRRHKEVWSSPSFCVSVVVSILLFAASLVVMSYAVTFATESASNAVTDIILSNVPVFDVDALFVYGMILFIVVVISLCIADPKRTPFTLHSLTLFIVIRSVFVSLTHISPFPTHTAINFGTTITKIFFGGDLFFSGHTGAPFLLALMYWNSPRLRYLFLAWSLFFAVIVLLGHLHYSIDVLAAFFITYAIYDIAKWLFPADCKLFHAGTSADIQNIIGK